MQSGFVHGLLVSFQCFFCAREPYTRPGHCGKPGDGSSTLTCCKRENVAHELQADAARNPGDNPNTDSRKSGTQSKHLRQEIRETAKHRQHELRHTIQTLGATNPAHHPNTDSRQSGTHATLAGELRETTQTPTARNPAECPNTCGQKSRTPPKHREQEIRQTIQTPAADFRETAQTPTAGNPAHHPNTWGQKSGRRPKHRQKEIR